MISLIEILNRINREVPCFAQGESYIEDTLECDAYARDGATRRWELFVREWNEVREFVRTAYPSLGERELGICLENQMGPLPEKIYRFDKRYECYLSILRANN
jgi:hypothetical protein